jgi:putative Mg2+ transporter-C (MgtC) family protein
MMDYPELILRLLAATLIGSAIGLNRDLHGKPTGVRTLSLVGLGSALAVMASFDFASGDIRDWNALSRAIQGVITGIGFLGAGVIVRQVEGTRIHGITTAACIWLTACLGIVCGIGAWRPVIVAGPIIIIVLVFGGPFEKAIRARLGQPEDD